MFSFTKDTYITIDRTEINFKGIEFKVMQFNDNIIEIKLTKKGIEDYKKFILNRSFKYGDDDYLINFLTEELEGELSFTNEDEHYQTITKLKRKEETK
mgnify:FL=1|tara:strand:- start:25 stop:318 length:294 start_codon:yes stop_codon:yes gene_type:complete